MSKFFTNITFLFCFGLMIRAFFLPWVQVESSLLNQVAQSIVSKKEVTMISVSGYDFPKVFQTKGVKVLNLFSEIFFGKKNYISIKSYAVYAIPFVGTCVFFLFLFGDASLKKNYLMAVALAWIFSFFLAYKLWLLGPKIPSFLEIAYGLWACLGSIAGMGLCAFFKLMERS
ncbi:hypothetical protein AB834_01055 [PVC group bacterium (ex Bugula neritina AB1)]|nr:hypothetical protein AB834_01055 [PVC group bacterium (ex Bugula neritina AB1)]